MSIINRRDQNQAVGPRGDISVVDAEDAPVGRVLTQVNACMHTCRYRLHYIKHFDLYIFIA